MNRGIGNIGTRKAKIAGFTLIELMIAVAIVGILAALALPAFGNYMTRARVSEAVNVAQGCKTSIAEFQSTNGAFPPNANQASCSSITTENIASMTWVANVRAIQITFAGENSPLPAVLQGRQLRIQPVNNRGALADGSERVVGWRCAITNQTIGGDSVWDFMPSSCRNAPLS